MHQLPLIQFDPPNAQKLLLRAYESPTRCEALVVLVKSDLRIILRDISSLLLQRRQILLVAPNKEFIHKMNYMETDNIPATENNAVMVGLLDACVKNLQNQGMKKMFIDGVASELDSLKQLGRFLESQDDPLG